MHILPKNEEIYDFVHLVAFPFPTTLDVHGCNCLPRPFGSMVTLKDAVAETRAHFDLQTCPARAPKHEDSLRPGRITTAMTRSETKAATWKYTSGSFRISEFTVRRRFRQEFLNSVIAFASCICRSPRLSLQGRCTHIVN